MIEYILVSREKPELVHLSSKLDAIENEIGPDEIRIRHVLLRDVRREQKRLRSVYPDMHYWSRITQTVTAPALLYGVKSQDPLIMASSAGIIAIAKILEQSIERIQDKHRWMTLIADALTTPAAGM